MTPAPLTFRASRDGTILAAYLGACRVGYVTSSGLWWTNLLRPEGGCWVGRAEGPEAARAAVAGAVGEWVAHAGLCSVVLPPVDKTETAPSDPAKKGPKRSSRLL